MQSILMSARHLQSAATDLVPLERLEERLEIALAEAFVALALDELEEHGAKQHLREDLQQQPGLDAVGCAVHQDTARPDLLDRQSMTGQPVVEHFVVRIAWRGHQGKAGRSESIDGRKQVVGKQRDVLDAFAAELHQELLDLPRSLRRLLVERDANLPVRSGQSP